MSACSTCVMANPPSATNAIIFYRGRIADTGDITVECNRGHTAPLILDERKHDLLFQSGCLAFLDGYEREAVASFAARSRGFWNSTCDIIRLRELSNCKCVSIPFCSLSLRY